MQIPVDVEKGEVPVYVEFLVPNNRKEWISYLRNSGIETRPFYPNIDTAKYLNCRIEKNNNSKIFSDRGIYLPSGPSQNIENAKKCIQLIKRNL